MSRIAQSARQYRVRVQRERRPADGQPCTLLETLKAINIYHSTYAGKVAESVRDRRWIVCKAIACDRPIPLPERDAR